MGIQLNTPAHHALKDGHIKFLDVITQLNEDDIESKEWFEHSTKSKTRPLITILRNQNTAFGIKHFLNKGLSSLCHPGFSNHFYSGEVPSDYPCQNGDEPYSNWSSRLWY